jgi:hypothetical protein
VSNSQSNIIIWLEEINNFTKDFVMLTAVKSGNMEIIIWLIGQGYELTKKMFETALQYGHINILEWANDNHYYSKTITGLKPNRRFKGLIELNDI